MPPGNPLPYCQNLYNFPDSDSPLGKRVRRRPAESDPKMKARVWRCTPNEGTKVSTISMAPSLCLDLAKDVTAFVRLSAGNRDKAKGVQLGHFSGFILTCASTKLNYSQI